MALGQAIEFLRSRNTHCFNFYTKYYPNTNTNVFLAHFDRKQLQLKKSRQNIFKTLALYVLQA